MVRHKVLVFDSSDRSPIAGAEVKLFRQRISQQPFAVGFTNKKGWAVIEAEYDVARPSVDAWWFSVAEAPGYAPNTVEGNTAFRRNSSIPMQRASGEKGTVTGMSGKRAEAIYSLKINIRDQLARRLYVRLNLINVATERTSSTVIVPDLKRDTVVRVKDYWIEHPNPRIDHQLLMPVAMAPNFKTMALQIEIWEYDNQGKTAVQPGNEKPIFSGCLIRPDFDFEKSQWPRSVFVVVSRERGGGFRLLNVPNEISNEIPTDFGTTLLDYP
jgi:hypothetical protein